MIYSIKNFALSRLNNQEFLAFGINFQKALTDANRENLTVEASTLSQYNTLLQQMMDQVYTTQASQFTADMKAANTKRDVIYKRLRMKLQAGEYAEVGSRLLKYSEVLKTDLLGKYLGSVTTLAQQEKTAVLSGFIYDLRDKLDDDAIEELAIEDDIAKLELANTAFVKAYNERTTEKSEQELQKTALLREKITDLYLRIALAVQYVANSQKEADAEKAAECQSFVKLVNVLIDEAKQRLAQRLKGNTDDEEETNADNTQDGNTSGTSGNTSGNNSGTSGNSGSNAGSNTGSNTGGSNTGNDDFVVNDGTAEY